MSFYKCFEDLERHQRYNTKYRHPPGNEIYRHKYEDGRELGVFEIDGQTQRVYCENLCYFAKLFLDHKTLQYDVTCFFFYIVGQWDEQGFHIIGYFSKEKVSAKDYNLACILCLPHQQRKGYGKFIIAFSYELSLKEGKLGTPERPFSDLGKASYRAWWLEKLLDILIQRKADADAGLCDNAISIKEISDMTSIMPEDIIGTLDEAGLLLFHNGTYILNLNSDQLPKLKKLAGRPGVPVHRASILWQRAEYPR